MTEIVEALSQVFKPPFEVIQAGLDQEWSFAIGHFPGERSSEEDPPTRLREPIETISIDHFLGVYEPSTQRITIFSQAVEVVAAALKAKPEDVRFVMRLHEWAHALLHLGLTHDERNRIVRNDALWPGHLASATEWFEGLDSGLDMPIEDLTPIRRLLPAISSAY